MSVVVLDASALLALIKNEPGGEMVEPVIAGSKITAINYAEVVSHFVERGATPADVDGIFDAYPIDIIACDAKLARQAGELRALTKRAGLSLGDRFCLALAERDGLPAWTADRQWQLVAEAVGVHVKVIR